MRRAMALGLVLNLMLAPVGVSPSAAASDPAGFDGSWSVLVLCTSTTDGAFGYTLQFIAEVKAGVLHAQYGTAGQPASLALDGAIAPDGTARLAAKGLTGDTDFTQARVRPATPYGYDVTASFKGSRGTGSRVGTQVGGRICNFTFLRR